MGENEAGFLADLEKVYFAVGQALTHLDHADNSALLPSVRDKNLSIVEGIMELKIQILLLHEYIEAGRIQLGEAKPGDIVTQVQMADLSDSVYVVEPNLRKLNGYVFIRNIRTNEVDCLPLWCEATRVNDKEKHNE